MAMLLKRLDSLATIVLVACAIGSTVSLVVREQHNDPPVSHHASFVPGWRDIADRGNRIGSEDARAVIIEIGDYECPACRRFARVIHNLRTRADENRRPSLVFIDFPLPLHTFAVPAARAANCAAWAGRFPAYHELLFGEQDKFARQPWTKIAQRAGIVDTTAFRQCLTDQRSLKAVVRQTTIGLSLRIEGTPTTLVNGWRLTWTPNELELKRIVELITSGAQLSEAAIVAATQ
jgi:protein-disulfide isomerase